MRIRNNSQEFNIRYDNKDFTVYSGLMDIANNDLATFIINKGRTWGMNVVRVQTEKEQSIMPITEVIEKVVKPVEEKKPEVVEPIETKEEKPKAKK